MNDEREDALDADEARALAALEAAERLDPPPGFAAGVMGQLSSPRRVLSDSNPGFWTPRSRRQAIGGGGMSSKKVLLGIAAVAVLAIGYFAVTGFPPTGPGSDATVGAAKKYQSEQIAQKDVTLSNPEIQRVLQSDAFHKLVTNPQTRAILTSKEFQKAIASIEVQGLLGRAAGDAEMMQELDSAFDSKAVGELMSYLSKNSEASAALGSAFEDAAVERALDQAADKSIENASGRATDSAAGKALDAALSGAIQDRALERLLEGATRDAAFTRLLANEAFQDAMQNPAFAGLLADPAFGAAFADRGFLESISNPAILEAARGGLLEAALEQASSAAAGAAAGAAIDKASDAAQGRASGAANGR
jgi:hypothetical protein